MALENVMRVDGGHIVTGGGAGESSVEIDWEDWCELTPEEQETGDWTIINCPWADGNVSVDLMTKLWENPNPAANFAAQSSQIDLTGYEYVMAISTIGLISIAKNVVGNYINLNEAGSASGGTIIRRRLGIITSTGISWEAAYQSSSWSAGSADNSLIKPYQIFGIKLTATVKINAIAMDVSTSADKCMLSDGVTSVEDILADTGWVQISTTGVYYRKIGKQVTIKGTVTTGTSWTTIATLPKGYRPASNIYRGLYSANNGYASLFIGPTGVIQSAGTSAIQFMESFLID